MYFPNHNSEFALLSDANLDMEHFLVRGNKIQSASLAVTLVRSPVIDTPSSFNSGMSPAVKPIFSNKKSPGVCIKIIQAVMKRLTSGKVEFTQTFIVLNEEQLMSCM